MSCGIYKITNIINNHSYIGQSRNIELRWKKHHTFNIREEGHKPLYCAFKKYGIENFKFQILEICSVEELNDKERYWIEYYNSFYNGYNLTEGGAGMPTADTKLIKQLWDTHLPILTISQQTGYDRQTIRTHLRLAGVTEKELQERAIEQQQLLTKRQSKAVAQLDKNTNDIITTYNSISEATRAIGGKSVTSISKVCNGKQHTAYGYKWKFI